MLFIFALLDIFSADVYNKNMKVNRLKLTNFRNYENAEITLDEGITLIVGKNAQGKTNLIESLIVASTTKSPRTADFSELILDGKDFARAEFEVERNFGKVQIAFEIDKKGEKKFYVNNNAVSKMSDVFGNLVVIYFNPIDLRIVSASPQERRDFMDTDISQLSGSYYNLLQRYNKILLQRNKLLKFEKDRESLLTQIEVWNEQLASVASLIVKTRKSFIEKLKEPARESLKQISSSKDELEIEYVGAKGTTSEEIKEELLKSLRFNLERDLELGYTTIGPHRDDVFFGLNHKDARSFSSQGQKRSIVLAIRFAEMEIFSKEIGENPLLVLDDVFSELDTTRQKKLYEKMREYQSIITGTLFKFKPNPPYVKLTIDAGKIKPKTIL